jgi:hypothetical protein
VVPNKDEQPNLSQEPHLLPYISRQPEGNSDADTGHMWDISWAAGISPQGNAGEGTVGNLRSVSGISSNPE